MIKFFLTALCCFVCLSTHANDNLTASAFHDPFAPQFTAELPSASNCNSTEDWLLDHLPLEQLKLIGLIQYADHAVALWLTPSAVVIDSRLDQLIAQEQWQIVQIEAQRVRLQHCQQPSQQKTIHL
ncbi:hypothetical protein ACUHGC_11405 [Testudinibacter sp. P27/CKL/0425]